MNEEVRAGLWLRQTENIRGHLRQTFVTVNKNHDDDCKTFEAMTSPHPKWTHGSVASLLVVGALYKRNNERIHKLWHNIYIYI
jgi:hypothetical protein